MSAVVLIQSQWETLFWGCGFCQRVTSVGSRWVVEDLQVALKLCWQDLPAGGAEGGGSGDSRLHLVQHCGTAIHTDTVLQNRGLQGLSLYHTQTLTHSPLTGTCILLHTYTHTHTLTQLAQEHAFSYTHTLACIYWQHTKTYTYPNKLSLSWTQSLIMSVTYTHL